MKGDKGKGVDGANVPLEDATCIQCGHRHTTKAHGWICIGCPCPTRPGMPAPATETIPTIRMPLRVLVGRRVDGDAVKEADLYAEMKIAYRNARAPLDRLDEIIGRRAGRLIALGPRPPWWKFWRRPDWDAEEEHLCTLTLDDIDYIYDNPLEKLRISALGYWPGFSAMVRRAAAKWGT